MWQWRHLGARPRTCICTRFVICYRREAYEHQRPIRLYRIPNERSRKKSRQAWMKVTNQKRHTLLCWAKWKGTSVRILKRLGEWCQGASPWIIHIKRQQLCDNGEKQQRVLHREVEQQEESLWTSQATRLKLRWSFDNQKSVQFVENQQDIQTTLYLDLQYTVLDATYT